MADAGYSGGSAILGCFSLKGQEEVLPTAKLEQWPYKDSISACVLVNR